MDEVEAKRRYDELTNKIKELQMQFPNLALTSQVC